MTPPPFSSKVRLSSRKKELARLVRDSRERLSPDQLPCPQWNHYSARRPGRVSQERAATAIGYSVTWLSKLERGDPQSYSTDFLHRVADTMQLNAAEKDMLFLLATGHEPAAHRRTSRLQATDDLRRLVEAQPWPSYLSSSDWDVIAYNEPMKAWFPWVTGHRPNIMRWVLTSPDAPHQLHRWETDWAAPMITQMRLAHARRPDDANLTEIITDILEAGSTPRRLWQERPTTEHCPDGQSLWLHVPHEAETQQVVIAAFQPMRSPESRLVSFIPARS